MINEFYAFLTIIGFLGWVGFTILFIFKAFGDKGEFYPKKGAGIGLIIAVFYFIWIVGMLKA